MCPSPKICRSPVNLIRYADDGVVTGVSNELLEQSVLPVVKDFMRERGLELSQEKTHVVHITDISQLEPTFPSSR